MLGRMPGGDVFRYEDGCARIFGRASRGGEDLILSNIRADHNLGDSSGGHFWEGGRKSGVLFFFFFGQ